MNFGELFKSKTVWGGIIALLAGIAGMFGYAVTPADTAEIQTLVASMAASGGGLAAILGRIHAEKKAKAAIAEAAAGAPRGV